MVLSTLLDRSDVPSGRFTRGTIKLACYFLRKATLISLHNFYVEQLDSGIKSCGLNAE